MTLAERCFDTSRADDELFDTLQVLLGGRPTEECLDPAFRWMVNDSWVDPYDGSVEIALAIDAPRLTRETADKVLALGFDMIYENVPREPYAATWYRNGHHPEGAASKSRDSTVRWEICKLRARVAELEQRFVQPPL